MDYKNKKIIHLLLAALVWGTIPYMAAAEGAEPQIVENPVESTEASMPVVRENETPAEEIIPAEGDLLESGGGQLVVNGKILDTTGLPFPWIKERGVVLVPVRRVAESLGYTVSWNEETQTVRIEDSIQQIDLIPGERIGVFQGKLENISLTRREEMQEAPRLVGDYLYVPVTLFRRFFNDIKISNDRISITVQKVETEKK
ncbi:MAG: copper amine oxidase N-terminal domain-containing protein [Dialister sp.]|nr:copper amine oxidase N-terminal domain-containing protein [Dialister sp.]MDU5889076.1 copper amine oxidase N-terminal domain-containing protein [Dialister sp.]